MKINTRKQAIDEKYTLMSPEEKAKADAKAEATRERFSI